MTYDRRDLLVRTGLLVGAGALAAAGCRSDDEARTAGAAKGLDTWEGVQASFELDRERAQLSTFLLAPHPEPVREAIEGHRRRLDADAAVTIQDDEERLEAEALQGAAGYLGVAPEEIALTGSTTMGLGLLYATLALAPGEEIVTTEHDFFSTHEALRLRADATGAAVRRVRLYDEPATASVDGVVAAIRDAVTPRTRAVALTWVHSSTGVKLPVRAIADALAERDVELGKRKTDLLCVDAVHAFGVEPEPLSELDCDFLVSGCHKWLFGPRGTGIVWGRPEAWAETSPTIPSFTDRESFGAWLQGREATAATTAGRVHAGRLPGLRAPLGARGRLRVPPRDRQGTRRRAHPSARAQAQGRARPDPGSGRPDACGRRSSPRGSSAVRRTCPLTSSSTGCGRSTASSRA